MSCATTFTRVQKVEGVNDTMLSKEGEFKVNCEDTKSSLTDLFPWTAEFKNMCRCIYADRNMASLTELMQYYMRNVSISVNECYTKPLRATKLKDSISETLILFLYLYRELSEDCYRQIYLDNMSDLLAMYIDMELKGSRRSKEDHKKICARLTSCLYIYLEHSTEHLLDTLIKVQFMSRSYHRILDPLITKVLRSVPIHPKSDVMYVRYLLVYRLWRKINGDVAVKNQIATTAVASLGPPPPAFPPCVLEDILPKVPKCQPNFAKCLLQQKFDVSRSCELFVKFCREKRSIASIEKDENIVFGSSSNRTCSQVLADATQKNAGHLDNNVNLILSDKPKQSNSVSLLNRVNSLSIEEQINSSPLSTISSNVTHISPKFIKKSKHLPQRKPKKSNEIVIIDLTTDIAFEKCIKKRKSRKLAWLEEIKKKIDMKVTKTSEKTKRQCKAANTNSTNSVDHPIKDSSSQTPKVSADSMEHTTSESQIKSDTNNCIKPDVVSTASNNTITSPRSIETVSEVVNVERNNTPEAGDFAERQGDRTNKSDIAQRVPGTVNVTKCCYRRKDTLQTKYDENVQDRFNKQTVIKRLIDDPYSDGGINENVESFKKICDLGAGCSKSVDNITMCSQVTSKDETDSSNHTNCLHVTKVSLSEGRISSRSPLRHGEIGRVARSTEKLNICTNFDKNHVECGKVPVAPGSMIGRVEVTAAVANTVKSIVDVEYERKSLCVTDKNVSNVEALCREKEFQQRQCNLNKSIGVSNENSCEVQTELEVANYVELNSEMNNKINDVEKYSTFNETLYNETVVDRNNDVDCVIKESQQKYSYQNGLHKSLTEYQENTQLIHGSVLQVNVKKDLCDSENAQNLTLSNSKKVYSKPHKLQESRNTENISENAYVVQDTDIQENIDGLSLLASVSQHIPHLKAESESKCEQIKVKDYASLRSALYNNQVTDDEADTNDSSNTISQLFKNPTTEIINRIVGIYPEDVLDKVALHVEVTSTSHLDSSNVEPEQQNNITPAIENTVKNLVSMENPMQPAKENTNVILNGETVVLLQKSPNSNLYIINKAVENARNNACNDEIRIKDKNWLSSSENYTYLDNVNMSDPVLFNLDPTQFKELPYQDTRFINSRVKEIKTEPEEDTSAVAESKSYAKKVSLPVDILPVTQQIYQEAMSNNVISKVTDKRKPSSKANLIYRQNIKQEFNNISNHITSSCGIQGCTGIHSHEVVESQHSLHVPVTRPGTLSTIYGNCAAATDLCVPYHKHCNSCGRSRCTCLNCTYDVVAHCRQCIHPATDTHVSCIESNSYFLPAHSSVQTPTVQEHDRTKHEAVIAKLYDSSMLQSNSLEKVDLQLETEKVFAKDVDNKLPLKKRLKAHAMMAYDKISIKSEKLDNYPAAPMMSIAALEALDPQKCPTQLKPVYDLPTSKTEESHENFHLNSNLVRRDYYKDVHSSNSMHHLKESTRKHDREIRTVNEQSNNAICQETCHQRSFKTPAQRKEVTISSTTVLKRFATELIEQEGNYKKGKKSQSPMRQTRSSKRNIPKVNYCYTDVDPEWNPSGESKRKRKKTSR